MAETQKVVLITGTSSGIGRSCADLLRRSGYRVYGTTRHGMDLPENDKAQCKSGSLMLDVTSEESVQRAVQHILQEEQRLDVLINNAGFGIAAGVEDTTVDEAIRQFDVNFFGILRMLRAVLPIMRSQGSGYIVNIGSIAGLIAIPYQGLYSASKFALEGLSESLRMEVGPFGIRVVLIEPGDHRTAFTANRRFTQESSQNPAYRKTFVRVIGRMESDERNGPGPERVAELVLKVINQSNPRLRYTTGPAAQRAASLLKRVVPYSIFARLLQMYYTL